MFSEAVAGPAAHGSRRSFFESAPARQAAVLVALFIVAAATCAGYLYGVYLGYFNSDSAAHQILADAILREGSLLPHDFAYNNQLIFWRNQLGIAFALKAGMGGYAAYVVGSSLNFAAWSVVAFLCIEDVLRDWSRSFLVTWLWLLPLGREEGEYILGQQTHTAWVVFALVLALQAWKATEGGKRAVWICAAAAFAMSLEAPTRAAMVLVPVAAAVVVAGRARPAGKLAAWVAFAALAGYVGDLWLTSSRSVLGVPLSALAGYPRFVVRANELARLFVDDFVGFAAFERANSQLKFLALYAAKTVVLFAFAGAFVVIAVRLAREWAGTLARDRSAMAFVGTCAVVHFAFGFWLVASVEFDPELRHFLWAPMLLKLVIIVTALDLLARVLHKPAWRTIAAVAVGLVVSAPALMLVDSAERRYVKAQAHAHRGEPLFSALRARMAEYGIHNVYGTYWVVQTAEVFVAGAEPAPLWPADGQVHFQAILVPPSRRCVQGEVLYVVAGAAAEQAAIAREVLAHGGRVLDALPGGQAVYIGPPVWPERDGCP